MEPRSSSQPQQSVFLSRPGVCLKASSTSSSKQSRKRWSRPAGGGGPQLTFALGDTSSTGAGGLHAAPVSNILLGSSSRQKQQGGKCRLGLLPLASLTTLGQQPFQQQLQPLGSGSQPTAQLPDACSQARGGLINIGLLLQPAARRQDTRAQSLLQEQHTLSTQQQHAEGAATPSAVAAASTQHRKAKHKHHKQQQQQEDGSCLVEAAAASPDAQQSQQQRKGQQHGTSGSPMAALLAHAAQAKLLVAGAASAIVSRTAMAPLERVKMDLLLKTSSRSAVATAVWVWQREGLAGFWKGNGLNLLRTAPFKALNFFSFDVYSKALAGVMSDGNNSARFIAGAMAGITATLVCFPLDVLRTRLMAPWGHKYGGPLTTLKCMVQYEGPGALYAGVVPAVIGMAPSGAVFYGVYDLLKARHLAALNANTTTTTSSSSSTGTSTTQQQQQQLELPVLYSLLYGALAGAAAETFLYPLEVIRRKMQLQSMAAGAAVAAAAPSMLRQHGLKAASGALAPIGAGSGSFGAAGVPGTAVGRIAAACSAIVRADGVAGFYAGLLPNMLQVLPSAALSYGTYESVKQMLGAV